MVRFGPAGTVLAEKSIWAVTYIYIMFRVEDQVEIKMPPAYADLFNPGKDLEKKLFS